MVGGPIKYFERVSHVLQTVSKSLIHIDENVGSGHAVKGYNNLLYACNLLLSMKVAQSLASNGINVDKALRTILAASGGSASMIRVHEYATHNRSINYNFKTNLLIKDMEIGLSLFENKEKDQIFPIFEEFRNKYFEAAKNNWEDSDVFDLYSFIEKPKH